MKLHVNAFRLQLILVFAFFAAAGIAPALLPAGAWAQEIDMEKARGLLLKERAGQELTAEEQTYLDRAKALRRAGDTGREAAARAQGPGQVPAARSSTGMTPLTDMPADGDHKDQDGGLYGGGMNTPPETQLEAAMKAASKIQPLDASGKPSPEGKIVLLSSGMSNTTQEYQAFMTLANSDPAKSKRVVLVDGAQGGMDSICWADPEDERVTSRNRSSPWLTLDERIEAAGVSAAQVQVLWVKQARAMPASLGEFPAHAKAMQGDLVAVLNEMKRRFPNLRIAYLSSRIYAGYAKTPLNPEPYAYEGGFSVRWLIQEQIDGDPALNFDPAKGEVKAPVLLWGPYLWADGERGRKTDGLVWNNNDFGGDGTHPSDSGRRKVAELLLHFLKTDPAARGWFLAAK